eukprot:g2629.t1
MPLFTVIVYSCPWCVLHHVFRFYLGLFFGVIIKERGAYNCEASILSSNHCSELDAIVLRCVVPGEMKTLGYDHFQKFFWLKFSPIYLLGPLFIPRVNRTEKKENDANGRDLVRATIKKEIENGKNRRPFLVFPEGGLTNGRVALLQYHRFMFSLGKTVQPIALSYSHLFDMIELDTIFAGFPWNLFYFFLQPFHIVTVHWMEIQRPKLDYDCSEFAQRVMQMTANKLGLEASPFLYHEKRALVKIRKKLKAEGITIEFSENGVLEIHRKKESLLNSNSKISPYANDEDIRVLLKSVKK